MAVAKRGEGRENIASGKPLAGSRKMLKALTRLGAGETGASAFSFFFLLLFKG